MKGPRMTDQVTIAERYRRATHSSNLKVESRRTGDPDLIAAYAWVRTLGADLERLSGEFDQVARDLHKAKTQTDSIMVMSRLKTLTKARVALAQFSIDVAPRWGVNLDRNVIAVVAGKALSAWLDPNCQKCNGVGVIGGYDGKVTRRCQKCGGTKMASHGLGNTDEERFFAMRLMSVMTSLSEQARGIAASKMRAR